MIKLDMEQVKECYHALSSKRKVEEIKAHQVVVYTMCHGGLLGKMAAEQPADFYIDTRVGKLPYPKREIEQAVETLSVLAENAGYDPHHLPSMPNFHNCGIF